MARDSRLWRREASSFVMEEGSEASLEPTVEAAESRLRCLVRSDCIWADVEPGYEWDY